MCLANFGQLSKPCSRAMTSWASVRLIGLTAGSLSDQVVQTRVMFLDARERVRVAKRTMSGEVFGLFFVLFEVGTGG